MTTHAEEDEDSVNSDVAVAKPRRGRQLPYIPPTVEPKDVEAPVKPDPPATTTVVPESPPPQRAEEEDDATEGLELDDASDIAVAKPRRGRRPSLLGGTSAKAAAALADEEVEDLEKAQDSVHQHRKAPETQSHRRKNNFDKVSSHTTGTTTSRATSFDLMNESQSFGAMEELPSDDNHTADDENDTLKVLSGNSLYTLHSQKSSKQIRVGKEEGDHSLATTLPTVAVPRKWCITRYKWTVIILAVLLGFSLGFLVPWLDRRKKPPQVVTEETLPPVNSTYGTSIGFQDDDLVKPPQVHSTDTPGATAPNPTTAPPSSDVETVAAEIETIDVWKLFGDSISSLPSASVQHLSQSSSELSRAHLDLVAKRFVQGTIHANVRKPKLAIQVQKGSSPIEADYVVPFIDTPLSAFDGEMPYPTARAATEKGKYPQGGDVEKWEAYLKEIGLREAESIQWDQENDILYVAHGQHIDVVDTKLGSVRLSISLPSLGEQKQDPWLVTGESDAWKPAPPQPFIEQLLLTGTKTHLLVFVSDYSNIHQARVKPLLKDSFVTRVYTYQLSHQNEVTNYEMMEPRSFHGRVLHAAEATSGQHIHFVTSSGVDTSRLLRDPLERLYYPDWHDTNYIAEVVKAAEDKYVPLFLRRLQNELEGNDIDLMPLTRWITNGDEDLTEIERQLELVVSAQQQVEELIVVASFSIVETNDPSATARQRGDSLTATSTSVFSTAFLGPSNVQVLGSTDTHLTLTVPGHRWSLDDEGDKVLQEATHFLQWELGTVTMGGSHRAATRFQAVGTVPGRLVQLPRQSSHSYGDSLHVATVLESQWKVGFSGEIGENRHPIVEESVVHKSFLNVLDQKTLQAMVAAPLQLFRDRPLLLSSVTFLDEVAYAFPRNPSGKQAAVEVVGLTKDPSVPALQNLGSISSIPDGFSPYLFRLSGDGGEKNCLVSIGQNGSALGLTNGWMISVWNATDPADLGKPLLQYSLEAENTIATWQPNTFRMTPGGLVLPMTVEYVGSNSAGSSENMRGFVVLDVSCSEIKERARIPHSSVVMSAGECLSGESVCGFEGKSFSKVANDQDDFTSLLTVAGTKVKLTTLPGEGNQAEAWSLSLP